MTAIGAGYEEIVGVSHADLQAYCRLTGEDEIDVFGQLQANGVVIHGYDGLVEQVPVQSVERVSGYAIIGAGGTKTKPSSRPAPRRLAPSAAAKKHPVHAAAGAAAAGKRAAAASVRATKPSKRDFKPITTVKGIFGDGETVCIGAGPGARPVLTTKKPLTPKQVAAVQKYNAKADKVKAATVDAKKKGDAAMNVAKKVAVDVKNASGAVRAMMAKQTKMKGLGDEEIAGDVGPFYQEIVGVSDTDLAEYCAVTGQDVTEVYGTLEANNIVVHGDDSVSRDLDAFIAKAEALAKKQAVHGDITVFGARPKNRGVRPSLARFPGESDYAYAVRCADYEDAVAEADEAAAQAEAEAVLAQEQWARAKGSVATVSRSGGCQCPKCGASLRLVLAPPPAVAPGRPAGVVVSRRVPSRSGRGALPSGNPPMISGDEIDVFGAPAAKNKLKAMPALRAATAGSCLCACPSCGTTLCLSIGPGGYDAKRVNAKAPGMYAAAAQAIHGEEITVFGVDGNGCLPGQVGYDPESIEVFGLDEQGRAPGDAGYDASTDPGAPGYTPPADPGTTREVPDFTTLIKPLDKEVEKVPEDGVPYTGQSWPKNMFGSKMYFDTNGDWGWVWGWDKFPHGNFVDTNKARWVVTFGKNGMSSNGLNWDDLIAVNPAAAENTAKVSQMSLAGQRANGDTTNVPGGTFGPLIGKPGSDFANLRWATKDQKWFWYLEEAPDWATAEMKYEAAKLLKSQQDADAAAAAAEAAVAAKAKAENDAVIEQAKTAMALAEEQEASSSRISASQQATQTAQQEIEQKKTEASTAAADAALAQQQAQAALAAQQAEQQAAQQQYQADLAAQQAEQRTYAAAMQAQVELDRRAAEIDLARQQSQQAYEAANPQQSYGPQTQSRQSGNVFDQGVSEEDSLFSDEGERDGAGDVFDMTDGM